MTSLDSAKYHYIVQNSHKLKNTKPLPGLYLLVSSIITSDPVLYLKSTLNVVRYTCFRCWDYGGVGWQAVLPTRKLPNRGASTSETAAQGSKVAQFRGLAVVLATLHNRSLGTGRSEKNHSCYQAYMTMTCKISQT